jgi:hypothetical protein
MARLPRKEDLGPPPSARSGRQLATFDAKAMSAPGRAMAQVGQTIAGVVSDIGSHRDAIDEYETERKFQEFKYSTELGLEKSMQELQPGQAGGFADSWTEGYKNSAKEFLAAVPDRLKAKYDDRLFDAERTFYRGAAGFARNEQKRSSIVGLEEFKNKYLARPGNLDRGRADYQSLVDQNPFLTPIEKDELRRKGLRDIEESHLKGLIERGQDLDSIVRDLGYGPELDTDENPELRAQPFSGKQEQSAAPDGEGRRSAAALFSPKVNNAITEAANKHGVDPNLLMTFARIESGGRPGVQTGSYKGLFQLSSAEFRKHGGEGDIFDPGSNANAAAAKLKTEAAEFEQKYGRAPKPIDLYLIHQQGEGGYEAHISNPERAAWESMASTAEGREKGERWAKQAIWGNIPDDVKSRFPGGVESVTSGDFVELWREKVERLGGGEVRVAQAEGPKSDAYSGPYANLSAEDRRELYGVVRTKLKQAVAEARQEVKAFDVLAEKGFSPEPGQLETLRTKVGGLRDPELAQEFRQAEAIMQWQTAARQARPEELDAFIRSEAERVRTKGAQPFDVKRLEIADKLLGTMRRELKDDPLGWADRIGMTSIEPIDFSSADGAQQSLTSRVQQADKVAQHYGIEPKYLRADERQQLATLAEQGGDQTLAVTAMIASSAGDRTQAVMGEIFKEAPVASMIGGHVADVGLSATARDAAEGLAMSRQEGFQRVGASANKLRPLTVEVLGASLSGMPKTESAIINTANLIYETRARKQGLTEFDSETWQQGLRELLGERVVDGKTYGGVVDANPSTWGTRNIIIPPFIAQDGWRQSLDALQQADFDAAGLGQPAGGDGKPIPISRVKGATLVQTGDGRYALSLGDPDTPGEERWVVRQDAPGELFEIDMRRLRPLLEKRRPDLFIGENAK